MQIEVPGEPRRSRGVPGSISGLKPRKPADFENPTIPFPDLPSALGIATSQMKETRITRSGACAHVVFADSSDSEASAAARGGLSRGGFWIWLKIGRFRGLGGARVAFKPSKEVGGEAPHLFGWF